MNLKDVFETHFIINHSPLTIRNRTAFKLTGSNKAKTRTRPPPVASTAVNTSSIISRAPLADFAGHASHSCTNRRNRLDHSAGNTPGTRAGLGASA